MGAHTSARCIALEINRDDKLDIASEARENPKESRAEACGREGWAAVEAKRVLLKKYDKGSLLSAIP